MDKLVAKSQTVGNTKSYRAHAASYLGPTVESGCTHVLEGEQSYSVFWMNGLCTLS